MLVEEATFGWHETFGVPRAGETDAIGLAMRRLALRHHPDQDGTEAEMPRINAAHEQTGTALENRSPTGQRPLLAP